MLDIKIFKFEKNNFNSLDWQNYELSQRKLFLGN